MRRDSEYERNNVAKVTEVNYVGRGFKVLKLSRRYDRFRILRMNSDPNNESGNKDGDQQEYEIYDYDNPEYEIDQGNFDELPSRLTADQTEEEVEAMREDRRMKNDEFQFETYWRDFAGEEEEWRGEWTR